MRIFTNYTDLITHSSVSADARAALQKTLGRLTEKARDERVSFEAELDEIAISSEMRAKSFGLEQAAERFNLKSSASRSRNAAEAREATGRERLETIAGSAATSTEGQSKQHVTLIG